MKWRKVLYKWVFKKFKMSNEDYAKSIGVKIGENCRLYIRDFGSEPYLVSIGDHVTVTKGVCFITHDGGMWVLRNKYPDIDYIRPIIIFDNCFIGTNSILLPGITVGPNSIVGAGSVVTKNVPPNSVAVGVPARVISTLEEYERHIPDTLPTKPLSLEEKKEFYLNYFGSTLEDWIKKMKELNECQ